MRRKTAKELYEQDLVENGFVVEELTIEEIRAGMDTILRSGALKNWKQPDVNNWLALQAAEDWYFRNELRNSGWMNQAD